MNPKDIVRTGYDKISYAYRGDDIDDTNPDHVRYMHWLTELLSAVPANASILDIGCGNGLPIVKVLADAGYAVIGVDISSVQIARARASVPNARFICADITELDFPPHMFAAIVSFYAIIHIPLPEQPALFGSIYRWLQPGGSFMATVGANTWTGTEDNWLDVADAPMYWSHADTATYQQWLGDHGFTIRWTRFVAEGQGGHSLVFAQKPL